MINKISQLARQIECQEKKTPKISFAKICANALENFEIDESLSYIQSEIAHWLLKSDLPEQLNVYNNFGQPPVTIFNNKRFVIDLYFWLEADTSIHGHAFSGAFKVIHGQSVHETYSIKEKQFYAPDIMATDIQREKIQLLQKGDVHIITSGNSFSHRVVHLFREPYDHLMYKNN